MYPAPWAEVVGKNCVWPDEDIILNHQAIPKRDAAFDRDPIAYAHITFDEGLVTDIAIAANDRARQYMHKCPYSCATADGDIGLNNGTLVLEITADDLPAGFTLPASAFVSHGWFNLLVTVA
jgi:hypothetical protein